ncbi:hypothetical protein BBP40_003020 [Aspergillus hancockii]|nr:hypothetical protein BBP40_003020 [Aspergillus hancockii]
MKAPTAFQPYVLSPLDHLAPPVYVATFASFVTLDHTEAVSALSNAVHHLLNRYPFLGGDVVLTQAADKVGRKEVWPTNAARLKQHPFFITRNQPQTITYIRDPCVFSNEFLPLPLEVTVRDAYPLIRFQANIMQDGIILTCVFFHPAIDGKGLFNLLCSLSYYCCGIHDAPSSTPELEAQTRKHITEAESLTHSVTSSSAYGPSFEVDRPAISRTLFFSRERLTQIRDACHNARVIRSPNGQAQDIPLPRLSLTDLACTILWLAVVQARAKLRPRLPLRQTTSLIVPIDVRSLLPDLIPEFYIGNAVVVANVSHPLPSMLKEEAVPVAMIAELAQNVHRSRKAIDRGHVANLVAHVQSSLDWGSFLVSPPEMAVSSLRQLKVYDWDFGSALGFVQDFAMPDPRVAGICRILPARPPGHGKPGNWEFTLALEAEAWEYFEELELIRWVSGTARGVFAKL